MPFSVDSRPTIAAPARPRLAEAIFDLSRGRQALLSVAQPAIGALLALGALPSARVIVLGLIAATTGFLAVFSLNDVLDLRVDREAARLAAEAEGPRDASYDLDTAFERHPLAKGALPFWVAVAWVAGLGVVSGLTALALGPACLACFVGAAGLEVVYCSLRSVTWTKTFVSGVMVGLGGLAGWVAVAPVSVGAGAFFLFLALWEIAGRNLPNDLSDLGDDSRVGLTTVSTIFGHQTAAKAIYAGSVLTGVVAFVLPFGPWARVASAVLVAAMMVVPAARLMESATSVCAAEAAAGRYFNRASLVPAVLLLVTLVWVFAPR